MTNLRLYLGSLKGRCVRVSLGWYCETTASNAMVRRTMPHYPAYVPGVPVAGKITWPSHALFIPSRLVMGGSWRGCPCGLLHCHLSCSLVRTWHRYIVHSSRHSVINAANFSVHTDANLFCIPRGTITENICDKRTKQEALQMQRDHTTRHKYQISYLNRLAIGEWLSRTFKVITIAAIKYTVGLYKYHFLAGPVVVTSLSSTVSEILPLFSVGDCLLPWEIIHLWQ